MSSAKRKFSSLTRLKKELRSATTLVKKSFQKITTIAKKSQSKSLVATSLKEEKTQLDRLKRLEIEINSLSKEISEEISQKTEFLQKKINKFRSLQEMAEANSFLLEHKRKDMLIQTEEMEASNEKII